MPRAPRDPAAQPPRLVCPRGHQFPRKVVVTESACLRCDHAPPPGSPTTQQCGCWVYVAASRRFGTFLIAVDHTELAAVSECETPDEVFALLDVWPA